MVNQIYRYYKKVKKALRYLLILSIAGYIGIELLNNFKEVFVGGHKFGLFFSNLCISTISAFIFYFIVVHIKEERDRENVCEYVSIRVWDILTTGHLFFAPFSKKQFEDLNITDFKRSVLDSVDRTASDSNYIADRQVLSWLEYYEYLKKEILTSINVVLTRYNHLDSELIKILSRIEHSLFFHEWNTLYSFQDHTFGMYQLEIQTFFLSLKDLEEYSKKHFPDEKTVKKEFWRVNAVSEEKEA